MPERSASRIYRVAERLVARSRRTLAALILPMVVRSFSTTEAPEQDLLR